MPEVGRGEVRLVRAAGRLIGDHVVRELGRDLQLESRIQSDRLFRARTRNDAWKASSASCSSRRMPRQVPWTIGPCRSTRAAKADSEASPSRRWNSSRSWPSVRPAVVPEVKSRRHVPVQFQALFRGHESPPSVLVSEPTSIRHGGRTFFQLFSPDRWIPIPRLTWPCSSPEGRQIRLPVERRR